MHGNNIESDYPRRRVGYEPAAGNKSNPKEMLPLVDRPVIEKIVNECVNAGIKEIVLVTHASKNAIENHFDTSFELESLLEERQKRQLLADVQSICPKGVTIMNVRQGETLGLGHAINCARPIVGDNPFVVVLPDVVMDEASADQSKENLAQLIARFEETGHSQVLVKHRPYEVLPEYSVVECAKPLNHAGDAAVITSMIENRKCRRKKGLIYLLSAVMCCLRMPGLFWKNLRRGLGPYSTDRCHRRTD